MSQGRARRSRLLLSVIGVALGIFLVAVPAELALRLIAVFSPETRYLATRRGGEPRRRFASLQEYLATRARARRPPPAMVQLLDQRARLQRRGVHRAEAGGPLPDHGRRRFVHVRSRAVSPERDDPPGGVAPSCLSGPRPRPAQLRDRWHERHRLPDDHRARLRHLRAGSRAGQRLRGERRPRSLPSDQRRPIAALAAPALVPVELPPQRPRAPPERAGRRRAGRERPGTGALPTARPTEQPRGGQVVDPGRRLRGDEPALVGPIFDEKVFRRAPRRRAGALLRSPRCARRRSGVATDAGAARGSAYPCGGARRPAGDHPLPVRSAGGRTSPLGGDRPATGSAARGQDRAR